MPIVKGKYFAKKKKVFFKIILKDLKHQVSENSDYKYSMY